MSEHRLLLRWCGYLIAASVVLAFVTVLDWGGYVAVGLLIFACVAAGIALCDDLDELEDEWDESLERVTPLPSYKPSGLLEADGYREQA